MDLQQLFSDDGFRRFVHRLERQLAKWLALMLVLVVLVAACQLTWLTAAGLVQWNRNWFEGSLIVFLDQLLLILIALEVLQTVTGYLRNQSVQIELVIVTALTALSRKLIIHPPGSSSTASDVLMIALAVVCLSGSYWLVRQSHDGRHPRRTAPARSFPGGHPSPADDGDDGEGSEASHRH